ncbi:MAG: ribonuclease H-like domain-containing protein [Snowella sp.]|nr:ribonuclease H-like domain-containing protein [Snowella sp.]
MAALKNVQVCDQDLPQDLLSHFLSAPAIAVDTETMGLIPQRDRLCLVQICDHNDFVAAIRITRGQTEAPNLKQLMESQDTLKVFHFARFDVAQLKNTFGIKTNPIFCTKIASKLARTYSSSHGLKTLVQELAQVELDKSAQTSDWGNVNSLSITQITYAANDVRYLLSIRNKLTDMLMREDRFNLAQKCFQVIPVLVSLDLEFYKDIFEH